MALIELTSEERNGKAYAKTILLNTDTIAVPIREVGGKSYIGVNESIVSGRPYGNLDIVYYLVTEDLATVVALSYDLFSATVITRDGRTPSTGYNDLIFRLDRVVGNIAAEGTGSKFMYHEDNGTVPIEFMVAEAPSAIISQVTIPVIPPVDTVKRYKALLSQLAPIASQTSGTVAIGSIWTITTFETGDNFSNWELISGSANTSGAVYRATTTAPTVWTNGSDLAYDGSPFIVSTDSNGDLNPNSNTLGGEVEFSFPSAGLFEATGTGLFPLAKTHVYFGDIISQDNSDSSVIQGPNALRTVNTIPFMTSDSSTTAFVSGVLDHTPITIEVYP